MISIANIQAKAETVTNVTIVLGGETPDVDDKVILSDKIGNTIQLDTALLYAGLVHLSKSRNMTLSEYLAKIGNRIEGK